MFTPSLFLYTLNDAFGWAEVFNFTEVYAIYTLWSELLEAEISILG